VNQASGSGSVLCSRSPVRSSAGRASSALLGTIYSALLGALVLGSVANGIALLGLSSDFEFMITAAVPLAAVIVDATARRGRQASSR
jgi:D-xylose transport system permease protein